MFLPPLFSGLLIRRFGARLIMCTGLAIIIIGGATFNTGTDLANYYGPITVVGVGWNVSTGTTHELEATAHMSSSATQHH